MARLRLGFEDHDGFQRTAAGAVVAGGLAAAAAALAGASPGWSAGLPVLAAGIVVGGRSFSGRRALPPVRHATVMAALLAALGLAWQTRAALGATGVIEALGAGIGEAMLGLLSGLVAATGLCGRHLAVRIDRVLDAFDATEADLDADERALCLRALEARARIRTRLRAGETAHAQAAALEDAASRVALAIVRLARRERTLAAQADGLRSATLQERLCDLEGREAAARDQEARAAYAGARLAIGRQIERLGAVRAMADRVRALMHGEVAALESAALALDAREGAAAAGEAAGYLPSVERLHEIASDVETEAKALTELGA